MHFSPDGAQLLTSSIDKKLILWDVGEWRGRRAAPSSCMPISPRSPHAETGTEILSLSGHAEPIYASCYLSADGRVVSGSHDRTVKLWDIGGADDRRVSAPVKRALLENVAGPTGLVRGAQKAAGEAGASMEGDGDGAADAIMAASPAQRAARAAGRAAVSHGKRVFGLRHAQQLEDEKGTMAPAGAHSDRVLVRGVARGSGVGSVGRVQQPPPSQSIVMSRDGSIAASGAADKEIKVRGGPPAGWSDPHSPLPPPPIDAGLGHRQGHRVVRAPGPQVRRHSPLPRR